MNRFDAFSFDELMEFYDAYNGLESWAGELFEAIERRMARDGLKWPETPVALFTGDPVVLLNRAVNFSFSLNPFDNLAVHNWGL